MVLNGDIMNDKYNYKILIDKKEFQHRIKDCITSDELDKFFNCTVFADKSEYRYAMIHGMIIASMLASDCELFFTKEELESKENSETNYMENVAKMLGVELDEEFKVFHNDGVSTVKLTSNGICFVTHIGTLKKDASSICLTEILNGNYKIERIKK